MDSLQQSGDGVGAFEKPSFEPDTFDLKRVGLHTDIVDEDRYERSVKRFREQKIVLPTFCELADPKVIDPDIRKDLSKIDKDSADPRNLFRVHWHNDLNGDFVSLPEHIVLPSELTGVAAPIALAFGNRFPMITAHKVLAAYACLVPRVVTGQFDPTEHRAIWPSTANYARGGVAISRLMGCRGVAVLPENMSKERFEWLDRWITHEEDVIRTTGSESNVKEIYDACAELEKDETNFILNQFSEFANHVGHHEVTGRALENIFLNYKEKNSNLRLAGFVAASGSAGTLGAGERLKENHGAKIIAVEALECPTMLYNGFGEHNIQGIGDKHIPLIHNVTNTDVVVAISDKATDGLNLVFTSDEGKSFLVEELGASPDIVDQLRHFGFSSTCNLLAAIKTAKALDLGPDEMIVTVATDGSELYESEKTHLLENEFSEGFSSKDASAIVNEHLLGADTKNVELLDDVGRNRIFNLGYYTWVEQQGIEFSDFEVRRDQQFWKHIQKLAPVWDNLINEFNSKTGLIKAK